MQQRFGVEKTDRKGNVILKKDGTPEVEIPEIVVEDERHPRGKYFVKRVGNHLVDYPTPISSLSVSRQYIEIGNFLRDYSGGFEDAEVSPFEQRLINIYFDTLRDLANSPANDCDWGRVKIMDVDEALAYLSA